MKVVLTILRIIVGVLFIFSGLVKANDPLGLSYKMNEFFEVWGTTWAIPYSLGLSITMIAFEIISGVAILVGYAFRLFSLLILLLTTFFTFLTAYVYLTGKIKECGCFGDCIPLTNAQTFWKDVVLQIFVVLLFVYRNRIKSILPAYPSVAVLILTVFFAFGFQWWTLEHLPVVDCLPYKAGDNLWEQSQLPPGAEPAVFETLLTYEKDGVKKDFTMETYPWQDSTWKFVENKTKLIKEATGEAKVKDFTPSDYDGNAHTEEILKSEGYVLLLFVRSTTAARTDNLNNLKTLADQAEALNIPTYVLSSDTKDNTEAFLKAHNLNKFPVFTLDATASKTAMRSNPGLMLLKDGTVIGKWSFRDYPKGVTLNSGQLELKK